jgi:hypothetical protein
MTRRMPVSASHCSSCRVMLRCVPYAISALRRIADQVQDPEGTVAEEQRAGEQHGQLLGAEQLHWWTGSPALDMGGGILAFGRDLIDSVVVVAMVLVPSVVVLVDHRVSPATGDEPTIDREGRHEGDRQRKCQASPE